jgi:hypothetical protein
MKSAPQETWTIVEMLRWTTDYFRAKGVSEPRASAEVLLAHVLQMGRLELYLRYDQPLTEELARFKALMLRRLEGEPVAYLTGRKEFWSLNFRVSPAVLIPRPETEVLVAAALEAAKEIMELGGEGQGPPTGETPVPLAPASSPKPSPPTHDGKIAGAGLKPAPTEQATTRMGYEELPISEANLKPKTENRKAILSWV